MLLRGSERPDKQEEREKIQMQKRWSVSKKIEIRITMSEKKGRFSLQEQRKCEVCTIICSIVTLQQPELGPFKIWNVCGHCFHASNQEG